MKVIHLPTNTGANPGGLAQALREKGVESEVWSYSQSYLRYPQDKEVFRAGDSIPVRELKRLWALRYVFSCDVVFFNFGTMLFAPFPLPEQGMPPLKKAILYLYNAYLSAMQRLEGWLLRTLKRKILIQYQGDDARQGDYSLKNFEVSIASQVEITYYPPALDVLKRQQIRLLDRLCHKIYALNPDLLHVLPARAEFLPYSHIALREWAPVYTQLENRPLRIAHAPTNRAVKGTALILDAVAALKESGYCFEFVLVEGLSHREAKEVYQTVDVFVDQVFAGWYGGAAVELMALGKPVMVYIREGDLRFVPREMADGLPFIRTAPHTVQESLQMVLEMPRERLLDIARQGRAFVECWHNPDKIVGRILQDLSEGTS